MTNTEFNEQFRRRTQQFAVRALIESVPFNTSLENQAHLSASISGRFAVEDLKMKNIQKCVLL